MSPVGWLHRTLSSVHRRSAKSMEPFGARYLANCARRTSVLQAASEPATEHLRMLTEYLRILTSVSGRSERLRALTERFRTLTECLRTLRVFSNTHRASSEAQGIFGRPPRFSSEIRSVTLRSFAPEPSGSTERLRAFNRRTIPLRSSPRAHRTTCSSSENLGFPRVIASPPSILGCSNRDPRSHRFPSGSHRSHSFHTRRSAAIASSRSPESFLDPC